ncbi:aspartate ammonia-lyase [Gleimia hominis]|uniref:Aspartate ammonia-lyase n=1 Tax=Gleimia hominis TaxID=595468 RepID=A0ABU3IC88_9ACTO|nr:aspartate ammonia-lyase [Gleimia hominis]MDT3767971.1 aspartate ammonia-lyase [Gleimia hominis]
MTGTRKEKDLLGTREVPAENYWGIHTLRAVENFQISNTRIDHYPSFVKGMVQVKKASARANARLHTLPHDIANAIEQACDKVLNDGKCMDQWPVDAFQGGAGTSVNMNTNEVIANLALETLGYEKGRYDIIHPNDHVNKSQSTNDAYPTGMRLGIYHELCALREHMAVLRDGLKQKSEKFKDVLKMGRTQLQDAVPMTLGQEFAGYANWVSDDMSVIEKASEELLRVNLGATAIGTGLNTPVGYAKVACEELAEVTGLNITSTPNLVAATPDTGAITSVHAAIKRFAVKLSKICNDLRLLSSGPRAGLSEIVLPAYQAGSSIMPAKINPVIPEVVNQACFKVIGNDVTVSMAAEAAQLELNVMEPVMAHTVFESITLLENSVKTLQDRCVAEIESHPKICREEVFRSIGIVTYFNEILGHAKGDEIGNEARETGKKVADLIVEKGLLPRAKVDEILAVENLVNPKYSGKIWGEDEAGIPSKQ